MFRRTVRIAGWTLVGVGSLILLAGVVMLVTPGPGFLVLSAGLGVCAIGGALVAVG